MLLCRIGHDILYLCLFVFAVAIVSFFLCQHLVTATLHGWTKRQGYVFWHCFVSYDNEYCLKEARLDDMNNTYLYQLPTLLVSPVPSTNFIFHQSASSCRFSPYLATSQSISSPPDSIPFSCFWSLVSRRILLHRSSFCTCCSPSLIAHQQHSVLQRLQESLSSLPLAVMATINPAHSCIPNAVLVTLCLDN